MALNKGLAKIKARKLWGKAARVEDKAYASEGRRVFRVGVFQEKPLPMFLIYGEGGSWEEAFGAADKAGYGKALKEGDVVMIFADPITRQNPEGEAVLLKRMNRPFEVVDGKRLERWLVRFTLDRATACRDILTT